MKSYSKEDRETYFQELRNRWKESKKLAENDETAKALHREAGNGISYWSFYFTLQSMKAQGLEGLPYVDCKTFKGWKETGYKVKKGEHSTIDGIVWMHPKVKNDDGELIDDDDNFLYPKLYHLFHKTQVEAL